MLHSELPRPKHTVPELRKQAATLDMQFSEALTQRKYGKAAEIACKLADKYTLIMLLCEEMKE